MIREQEWELERGSLYYQIENDEIRITRCGRLQGEIEIPAQIQGMPVTRLHKKAFLSQKKLTGASLPDTLCEMGEWAFAYCSSLQWVRLPKKKLERGKGIFQECNRLELIELTPSAAPKGLAGMREGMTDSEKSQIGRLLAATTTMLDAEYLLEPLEAGDAEWIQKWDSRLLERLDRDEEEGYTTAILCGEEDLDFDIDVYKKSVRRDKAKLCMKRLLNPYRLPELVRERLVHFLCEHTKGSETEEAWEVLLSEYGNERAYYELFWDIGAANIQNRSAMLADMGEEYAEMKAYLLQQGEVQEKEDLFAAFSL